MHLGVLLNNLLWNLLNEKGWRKLSGGGGTSCESKDPLNIALHIAEVYLNKVVPYLSHQCTHSERFFCLNHGAPSKLSLLPCSLL